MDELGIIEAAHKKHEEKLQRRQQDLMVVSRGTAQRGRVSIGSARTNTIVGEIDVEILNNGVVITVVRGDEAHFGPVSVVVV